MARVVSPNVLVVDQFPAFEDDGYTKRSGLGLGDFTTTVFKDGSVQVLTVDINEIGFTGEYKIEYVPNDDGLWEVQVLIDFNKEIWASTVTASEASFELIKYQMDKIDLVPTLGPAAVTTGSLMDRMMHKDANKTYNQGTDSLEGIRDRTG